MLDEISKNLEKRKKIMTKTFWPFQPVKRAVDDVSRCHLARDGCLRGVWQCVDLLSAEVVLLGRQPSRSHRIAA